MARYDTTLAGWPATVAVETSRIGSAGLSAAWFAALGATVHPAAAVALGAIAAATDYTKGTAFAVACTKGGGIARRTTAAALFAVLFVASVVAVDGVLLYLRSHMVAGPADTIRDHDSAAADLAAVQTELAIMTATRSTEQIRAAMDTAAVPLPVFRRTKECTDITKDESLAACAPILDLRKEMAGAIRKRELEAKRDAVQAKLAALGPKPAAADPQASVLATVTGLPEGLIAWGLVAVFGFALELAACFGRYLLHRPASFDGASGAHVLPEASLRLDAPAPRRTVATLRKFRTDGTGHPARMLNGHPKRQAKTPELPGPSGGTPPGGRRAEVLAALQTDIAFGKSFPSQRAMEERFNVPRSTLSDWLKEWEADGSIPARRTVGRVKVLEVA